MDSDNVMIVAIPQEAYDRCVEVIAQKGSLATLHDLLKDEILVMDLNLFNQVENLIKSRPELGYCRPQEVIQDAINLFLQTHGNGQS